MYDIDMWYGEKLNEMPGTEEISKCSQGPS